MLSQYKTLLRQGEELYEIIEKRAVSAYMKNDQFLPDKVEEHRKLFNADHIVHTPDYFLYLKRIEEITEVEYITTKTTEDGNNNSDSNPVDPQLINSGDSSGTSEEIHGHTQRPTDAA